MVSIIRQVHVAGARTHGPHPHKAWADSEPGSAKPGEVVVPLDGVGLHFHELGLMQLHYRCQGRADTCQELQQSQDDDLVQ